ncbi:hypothetical protein EZJ43_13315 [Pedobacter changchengzhani]|uniref:Pyrrolo-quinoline quinone repeat domain-containing protein n=1 Tax=Pedobacter changchengzhani TaxID=2529274 RepID=A0A4V2ZZZ1_9SPHI|nr:hypothetical protein EZJ43_13315 [Pedobacter changchengzhani]
MLVANSGQIYNYNLESNKVTWQYTSKFDTAGNRNNFAIDGQQIFMPFESGKFISFDVATGKIIWKQEVFGNEDSPIGMSSDENDQAKMLNELKPLFMTKPLIDGENVVIASGGNPNSIQGSYLYNFNKKDGDRKWHCSLPRPFNAYAAVKYRDNYFINSAEYLEKISPNEGSSMSYGLFDGEDEVPGSNVAPNPKSQFERGIYCQMQTDGNSLFIGDEVGKFYCFQLDKTGSVKDGDIMDPKNTFIGNPKLFKWTFSDKDFTFQKNGITFLTDNALLVEMKTGTADKSCIFALNTDDGKVKWKKVVSGDIKNWALQGNLIVGSTADKIFWIDANGENYKEASVQTKPLSNIEVMNATNFIYLTTNGIEIFDTNLKKAKVIFKKQVAEREFDNYQVKFLKK